MKSNNSNWFLLKCKPNQDNRAIENLENQNFYCYAPMIRNKKSILDSSQRITEPLFPGYVFIKVTAVSNWGLIRSTRGVLGFVKFSAYPAIVPETIVNEVVEIEQQIAVKKSQSTAFKNGENVLIKSGAFKDLEAVYQCQSGKERSIVLLNLLGKKTKVLVKRVALGKT